MNKFSILASMPALALVLAAPSAFADSYGGVTPDYPPNARPGQCFARVVTPEIYSTYSEKVIDQAERTETRVLPGEYGWDEKTVCTKEPSVEYFTVPATYRTITETIILKPASVRTETVPAIYGTTTRQVVVSEAHSVWKPGKGIASHAVSGSGGAYAQLPSYSGVQYNGSSWNGPTQVLPTGEVLCLVEVPAQYETITEQVVKQAARTVEIPVPAETQIVTRQVVDQPARVDKREIPGIYQKVRVRTIIRAEKVETYSVPATFRTIERKKLTAGGKLEWREVICDDKLNAPLPANAIPCSVAGGTCSPEYAPPVRAYTPAPAYVAPRTAYVPHGPGEDCETCAATYDSLRPAGYKGGKAVTGAYGKGKAASYESGGYVAASSGFASTTTSTTTTTAAPVAQGTVNMISKMQEALASRGYYKGAVNGLYTQPTSEALMSYQKDNHFAQGQLTLETARGLGIWN